MLCYFPCLSELEEFDAFIGSHFRAPLNNPLLFGRQLLMDESDEIIGEKEELLISSVDLSIDDVIREVRRRGGVVIPAHIDRSSFSIISQLGFIPPEYGFRVMEVSASNCQKFISDDQYTYITSSDAHCLEDILERESYLHVETKSVAAILESLR